MAELERTILVSGTKKQSHRTLLSETFDCPASPPPTCIGSRRIWLEQDESQGGCSLKPSPVNND